MPDSSYETDLEFRDNSGKKHPPTYNYRNRVLTVTGERSFPVNTNARKVKTDAITGTIGEVEVLIL